MPPDTAIIEIHLTESDPLFETPSVDGLPTVRAVYSDYVERRARKILPRSPLVIRIKTGRPASVDFDDATVRFREHFLRLADRESESLRSLVRYGWLFAACGFSFLLMLLSISTWVKPRMENEFLRGLSESLSIFGTVALWRPAEVLLYEWIPIYRRKLLLRRIARNLLSVE